MKHILLLAICLTLTVVAASDESVDITLKDVAHTLTVQGDSRTAMDRCLKLLADETLTPEQLTRVYPAMVRVAREANDREMIQQAIAACEERRIVCEELQALQSFAAPGTANPETVQIRDALEYMWNDIDWKNNEKDFGLFQKYLDKLSIRTNISLVVRAQAMVLNTAINYAYFFKLSDPLREKQYKQLLVDLHRTDCKVTPLTVYEALQRLYLATKEYLEAGETTMACGGLCLLSSMSYNYSDLQDMPAGDLVSVLCRRILDRLPEMGKRYECLEAPLYVRMEATESRLKYWYIMNTPYGNPSWSEYINTNPWKERNHQYRFSERIPEFTNVNQVISFAQTKKTGIYRCAYKFADARYGDNLLSNIFSRIIVQDKQISWETSGDKNIATIVVRWNDKAIKERIDFVSNTLAAISQPLEELRKYAELTEKRSKSDKPVSDPDIMSLQSDKKEAWEWWREFIKVGPHDSERGKALLKKIQPFAPEMFHITKDSFYNSYSDNRSGFYSMILEKVRDLSYRDKKRWTAWRYLPEAEEMLRILSVVKDSKYVETISGLLGPRMITSKEHYQDVCDFYSAAGYDLNQLLSLEDLRTLWKTIDSYFKYIINHPEIENSTTYSAYLIEQLIPVYVENAEKKPEAIRIPNMYTVQDKIDRARILAAFQEIISQTNTVNKSVFVEQTLEQLVSDLRADAKITDTSADVSGGIYAGLMRDFLEQGKVDTEKGKELLNKISALPDMPLAGPEFNKLLIAYPNERVEVYKALQQFGLLSGYKKLQWTFWTFLPLYEDYAKQFSQVDNLVLLKTYNMELPEEMSKIIKGDRELRDSLNNIINIIPRQRNVQSIESGQILFNITLVQDSF